MQPEPGISGRTPVPADSALVGLGALLDAERMGGAASSRLLEAPARGGDCRPVYVRYKPGTNCIAAYELLYLDASGDPTTLRFYGKCFVAADYEAAVAKLADKRWIELPGIRPLACLEAERVILYAFPNDAELDGLRLLSHPKKIQRALYDHEALAPAGAWRISDRRLRLTTIRHKPEKRAVTRVDSRAVCRATGEKRKVRVYLRTYRDDQGAARHLFMQHLADSLADVPEIAVPKPIAYLDDRQTLMVDNAAGVTLTTELTGPTAPANLTLTGAALARLHACPPAVVRQRPVADLLAAARDTGRTIAQLVPELRLEVASFLARLETQARELAPAEPRLVHGDFHPGQVLVQDQRVVLLDFDRAHVGDALFDLGNFGANLTLLELSGELDNSEELTRRFVDAYAAAGGETISPVRLRFWTAYGLFQLAVGPFRSLAANWPAEVTTLVAACGEVLR